MNSENRKPIKLKMKRKLLLTVFFAVLLFTFSCDEPVTVVTNYVHADGSVTRHIEMRNKKNNFKTSDLQVPFDSTWVVKDTLIIGEKKDTTWIKTAEKVFASTADINKSYQSDSGANKNIARSASFKKKFRWFYTIYRFSESVDKILHYGYPVKDFLNTEELNYFYSPQAMNDERLKSSDSLKYKAIADSVKNRTDRWIGKSLISEWIGEFSGLVAGRGGKDLSQETLKQKEFYFEQILRKYENLYDSLWKEGIIQKEMIGEKYAKDFRKEADSAINIVTKRMFPDFKEYSVRIVMPGKVIGTNGFIDKTDQLLWPVKSDFFTTESYKMYAESRIINTWAWVVTGVFVVFVITGLAIRKKFRG
jgi:hypothetical protein